MRKEKITLRYRGLRNRVNWTSVETYYRNAIKNCSFHRCHCCNRLFFERSIKRIDKE
jgi:hypothetical protein